MTEGFGSHCTRCGSPLLAAQAFCAMCGAPRQQRSGEVATAILPEPPTTRTGQAFTAGSRLYGAVGQVAGMAGVGFALPWQRLAGAAQPDIGAFLSAAAIPGAQRAIRASLKRPGVALAATTIFDLAVAVITGGTSALYKALPRLVLGGSTSVFSLVTGSKAGRLRSITGVLGAVTAVAQLGFAAYTLISGVQDGTSGWVVAPQVVAMASSFVMAAKTVSVAFRRT